MLHHRNSASKSHLQICPAFVKMARNILAKVAVNDVPDELRRIQTLDITSAVKPVPERHVSFLQVKTFKELIDSDVVSNFLADAFNISVGAATGFTGNPMTPVLNEIRKKIDNLQKDVDTLLHAEMNTAFDRFSIANNYLQNEETQLKAYEELEWVLFEATKAFAKVKSFQHQVFSKELTIYTRILRDIFNIKEEQFKPFSTLSIGNRRTIAENVQSDLQHLIDLQKKAEKKVPWYKTSKQRIGEKKKIQDQLNPLLKFCFPFLKLNIEKFNDDMELLQFVPDGSSDAARVTLENGLLISIWKQENAETKSYELKWSEAIGHEQVVSMLELRTILAPICHGSNLNDD